MEDKIPRPNGHPPNEENTSTADLKLKPEPTDEKNDNINSFQDQSLDVLAHGDGKGRRDTDTPLPNDDEDEDEMEGLDQTDIKEPTIETAVEDRLKEILDQQNTLSAQYAYLAQHLAHALDARLAQTLSLLDEAARSGIEHKALQDIYLSHIDELDQRFKSIAVVEAERNYEVTKVRETSRKNVAILWGDFRKQKNSLQLEMCNQLASEMVSLFKEKRNQTPLDVLDWINGNLTVVENLPQFATLSKAEISCDLQKLKAKLPVQKEEVNLSEFDGLEPEIVEADSLYQLADLAQQHATAFEETVPAQAHAMHMNVAPPHVVPNAVPLLKVEPAPVAEEREQVPIESHTTARSRSRSRSRSFSKTTRQHSISPPPAKRHRQTGSYSQNTMQPPQQSTYMASMQPQQQPQLAQMIPQQLPLPHQHSYSSMVSPSPGFQMLQGMQQADSQPIQMYPIQYNQQMQQFQQSPSQSQPPLPFMFATTPYVQQGYDQQMQGQAQAQPQPPHQQGFLPPQWGQPPKFAQGSPLPFQQPQMLPRFYFDQQQQQQQPQQPQQQQPSPPQQQPQQLQHPPALSPQQSRPQPAMYYPSYEYSQAPHNGSAN